MRRNAPLFARERQLVLGTAVDVVEHPAVEAAPCDPTQVADPGGAPQTTPDGIELDRLETEDRAQGLDDLSDARRRCSGSRRHSSPVRRSLTRPAYAATPISRVNGGADDAAGDDAPHDAPAWAGGAPRVVSQGRRRPVVEPCRARTHHLPEPLVDRGALRGGRADLARPPLHDDRDPARAPRRADREGPRIGRSRERRAPHGRCGSGRARARLPRRRRVVRPALGANGRAGRHHAPGVGGQPALRGRRPRRADTRPGRWTARGRRGDGAEGPRARGSMGGRSRRRIDDHRRRRGRGGHRVQPDPRRMARRGTNRQSAHLREPLVRTR